MSTDLATKYLPYVDEQFTTESKLSLITNKDFDFTGAKTVKVYKVNTSAMNDYDRDGEGKFQNSRYGNIANLTGSTEEFILSKDRSFTFTIDKLDKDETLGALSGASALARQNREVVIPEVDKYVINKMIEKAGVKTDKPVALTKENIYEYILKANSELDNWAVPTIGRCLLVTPDTYLLIKQNKDFLMSTDIAQEQKIKGVIAMVDGLTVIKIPKLIVPKTFGFLLAHPCATVAPLQLQEYRVHQDPPGISGELVEGRICYDAFVLDNKNTAIFYNEAVWNTGA